MSAVLLEAPLSQAPDVNEALLVRQWMGHDWPPMGAVDLLVLQALERLEAMPDTPYQRYDEVAPPVVLPDPSPPAEPSQKFFCCRRGSSAEKLLALLARGEPMSAKALQAATGIAAVRQHQDPAIRHGVVVYERPDTKRGKYRLVGQQ